MHLRGRKPKLSGEQRHRLIELRQRGMKHVILERIFGVSHETIRKIVNTEAPPKRCPTCGK